MLPPEPDLPLIHERTYRVRSYEQGPGVVRIRGSVQDEKPPGLYVEDDPNPLTIHHMVVDLVVELATMTITEAEVVFETHPHTACPTIADHYGNLVGLSIMRGFTHKVRELFGGPRGCTHTTALLQAMAPVAIQSIWSARMRDAQSSPVTLMPSGPGSEERRAMWARNLNTCHVWDADGPMVAELEAGGQIELPLWIEERYRELGVPEDTWHQRFRGG
jgi:hypothetical protein